MKILVNIQDLRDLRVQYLIQFEKLIDSLKAYLKDGC